MLKRIKGVNGGLGWVSTTGRPDMSAIHSMLPGEYGEMKPDLVKKVNAAVDACHKMPITILVWSIPLEKIRWVGFSDSSYDTSEKQRHSSDV